MERDKSQIESGNNRTERLPPEGKSGCWRGGGLLVNHECGHLLEELAEQLFGLGGEGGFEECIVHKLHPTVTSGPVNPERKMAGTQTRVSALENIFLRAAKAVNQEISKAMFGGFSLVLGIHGPQDVIVRDLAIETSNEARKTFFTDDCVNIFVHTCVRL